MNNFVYNNPTKIVFGKGVIDTLGSELQNIGAKKVLLVYGQNSIKNNGVYDKIIHQLSTSKVEFVEYSGVRGNPLLSHTRVGIELARSSGVDTICAVGGGSVIDEAKAISIGVCTEDDIWEYYAKRKTVSKTMRLVTVLTLPATGSEANGISVLTNEETNEKTALVCPGVLNPAISFLDPDTTFSLSASQTAYACADIISHMTEGYFTTTDQEAIVQDKILEAVILSVMEAMANIQKSATDYNARAAFMWSASLAWSGILHAGLGGCGMPCHALEMPMSAVYDMAHGAGLSVIIPSWIEKAGNRHISRLSMFSERILGLKSSNSAEIAQKLRDYYKEIGAPTSFSEAGVMNPDIDLMAELAYESFKQRGVSGYDIDLIKAIYQMSL